jgi:hypothetical protein
MIKTYKLKLKPTKAKNKVIKSSTSTKSNKKANPVKTKKLYSKSGRVGCFRINWGEFHNTKMVDNNVVSLKASKKRGVSDHTIIL